jgi:hypothetical protein
MKELLVGFDIPWVTHKALIMSFNGNKLFLSLVRIYKNEKYLKKYCGASPKAQSDVLIFVYQREVDSFLQYEHISHCILCC